MNRFPDSEKELIIRLSKGDYVAFDSLYKLYAKDIFARMKRLVYERAAAEEIHQDVFMKIWEQRAVLDPDVPFRAVLMRMAKSKAIDYYRKTARDQKLNDHFIRIATQYYDHLEEWMSYKETSVMLNKCIEKLPPQRQKIFRYCKLEGHSYDETAQKFNVSLSTIKDHMTRSIHFLKEEMAKQNPDLLFLFIILILFR